MWRPNGVLIQDLEKPTNYVKNFPYQGSNAYFQYPLANIADLQCRALTDAQQFRKLSENEYLNLEFISDYDLYQRYVDKCNALQIKIRALFIESAYSDEIWNAELPKMQLLGYEYCPIPIDEQVITDMDWYTPFSMYWKKLNEYGLFDSYTDALAFADAYKQATHNGEVGDGDVDLFICRVSRVCLTD